MLVSKGLESEVMTKKCQKVQELGKFFEGLELCQREDDPSFRNE
jgi:hypothetical protein